MLTLSEAREKAAELIDEKIPSTLSLHNWKAKGVISEPVDYENKGAAGGRVGFYPNYVIIEIAIAAVLKEKLTLKRIAKARSLFIDMAAEEGQPQFDREKAENLFKDLKQNFDLEQKLFEQMKATDDPEKKSELARRMVDIADQQLLLNFYAENWQDFEHRLKEAEE